MFGLKICLSANVEHPLCKFLRQKIRCLQVQFLRQKAIVNFRDKYGISYNFKENMNFYVLALAAQRWIRQSGAGINGPALALKALC